MPSNLIVEISASFSRRPSDVSNTTLSVSLFQEQMMFVGSFIGPASIVLGLPVVYGFRVGFRDLGFRGLV